MTAPGPDRTVIPLALGTAPAQWERLFGLGWIFPEQDSEKGAWLQLCHAALRPQALDPLSDVP